MKISFITNLRAPYRTLQVNEWTNIPNTNFHVYYTDPPSSNRTWNLPEKTNFKETDLSGYRISKKYGYLNKSLTKVVRNSDLVIIGGYEKPTYLLISLLCRIFKVNYILLFDGISTDRIESKEAWHKKIIKKAIVDKSKFIFANGTVSKKYFVNQFEYNESRIFNQTLSVDTVRINELKADNKNIRIQLREKYKIASSEKVLIYSGRLIDIKNVERVIHALSKMNRKDVTFLIVGGGELENHLQKLSDDLKVKTIITGFVNDQESVFKHYFAGDYFILPSIEEPWGLVVNEAMSAGLPVIVSELCGCSLDLVKDGQNGYKINPFEANDISNKLETIFNQKFIEKMNLSSLEIIKKWTFEESKSELQKIIKLIEGP